MQVKGETLRGQSNNSGQIVVEYVLLLVIAVAIAALLTTTLVSRNSERPGIIVLKWRQIIQVIGVDRADDINPTQN